MFSAGVIGAVEEIRAENTHRKMHGAALLVSVECVVEGGAVIPLQIIHLFTQLVLDDVEVAALGPVVPKVRHLQEAVAAVYDQNRVKLERPWRRRRRRCRCRGG